MDSILSQSGIDKEMILVDDGSTDGSEILCDELAKNIQPLMLYIKKMVDCLMQEMLDYQ